MKQEPFIEKYSPIWNEFEDWLNYQEASRRKRKDLEEPKIDVPYVYRQIGHHLALARSRLYGHSLIDRLSNLTLRGHQRLYTHQPFFLHSIASYFAWGFPALVRQEWKLVMLSAFLFLFPFLGAIATLQFFPDMVYTVLDPGTIGRMEMMYAPELHDRLGRERESDSDVLMFGFYIRNNTGIDFQVFSGGILFGLGTVFFLIFNGIFLGAVAGHLTQIGYNDTFWGFVSGHSSFELIALMLAGASGFKLAQALISPGRKTRSRALIDNGQIAVRLLYGTATMTIIAAFVEAFWSSIAWMPLWIKYSVGIGFWVLILAYFLFMGRSRRYAA